MGPEQPMRPRMAQGLSQGSQNGPERASLAQIACWVPNIPWDTNWLGGLGGFGFGGPRMAQPV